PCHLSCCSSLYSIFLSLCSAIACAFLHSPSLHDALPILFFTDLVCRSFYHHPDKGFCSTLPYQDSSIAAKSRFYSLYSFYYFLIDRKSTRLNSSHVSISYAVFCLKKKQQHPICRPMTATF